MKIDGKNMKVESYPKEREVKVYRWKLKQH